MSGGTRLDAIRARLDGAGDTPWRWDTTHREIHDAHNDIIVTTHDADSAEFIVHAPDDITWLLTYTAALRAVAEAAEEHIDYCHESTLDREPLQSALQRWREVTGE